MRFDRCVSLIRLGAVIASLLPLLGCIESSYDLSADLIQVFPLESLEYTRAEPGARTTVYNFRRTIDGYDVFEEKDDPTSFRTYRFFQIPEYDGFIVQIKTPIKYYYAFVKILGNNMDFSFDPSETGKKQIVATNYLDNIVDKAALQPLYPDLIPVNPARDTLRMLTELARRRIELKKNVLTNVVPLPIARALVQPGHSCGSEISIESLFCRSAVLKTKDRAMIAEYGLLAETLPLEKLQNLRADQRAWKETRGSRDTRHMHTSFRYFCVYGGHLRHADCRASTAVP